MSHLHIGEDARPPLKRVLYVPYTFKRDRSYRSFKFRHDNHYLSKRRRIITLLARDHSSSRYNWFKHNRQIRLNFESVSYMHRWY